MLKGLAYDLAKEEFYLEPSLKIFEDFHKYLSENGYHISAVDHFDIHASKNNINVIFSYDASVDDYFYLLRTIDSNKKVFPNSTICFRYEDNVYRLYTEYEESTIEKKDFSNIKEILDYFKFRFNITI